MYTLPHTPGFAISCGRFSSFFFIRDVTYTPEQLKEFFEQGFALFEKRLAEFRTMHRVPTLEESKELQFMVAELIEAKQMLFESGSESGAASNA